MQTVTSGLQYKTVMQSHKWFAVQNWWRKQSQVDCNTKQVMQTVKTGLQYKTGDANSHKWFAIQN